MDVNRTRLHFAATPPLNDLCSLTLTLPSASASKSQVIRCRELIFTEPEILATPSLRNAPMIQIVMQQSLYKTGRLQARCHKMEIQVAKPRRVTPADFEACLRYTLLAKLAPAWNKVGEYLIQGRDFLTNQQKCNAVNIDMNVMQSQLTLAIRADIVKSVPIQLSDVDICPSVISGFLNNNNNNEPVREYSINYKWCHVLPSMKKGQIVNVHQRLPVDCPFQSYKDVKRYWKNNYGYRLPEEETGLMYYQIYFKPIGPTLFTYPSCCVRPRDILVFPRSDPQPIIQAFLADLHAKLPTLCGVRLRFAPKASYTNTDLITSLRVDATPASDLQVNLTQRIPSEMRHWQRKIPVYQSSKTSEVIQGSTPDLSQNDNVVHSSAAAAVAKKIIPVFKPQLHSLPRSIASSAPKIVPMFHRVTTQVASTSSVTTASNNEALVRKRPSFCAKLVTSQPAMHFTRQACPRPDMLPSNCTSKPDRQSATVLSTAIKRKSQMAGGNSAVKKSRAKPQVQQDIDVETLARNNQMHKVNTATVLAWLRDRGVACKSNDKKTDLTEKVLMVLRMKTAEQ